MFELVLYKKLIKHCLWPSRNRSAVHFMCFYLMTYKAIIATPNSYSNRRYNSCFGFPCLFSIYLLQCLKWCCILFFCCFDLCLISIYLLQCLKQKTKTKQQKNKVQHHFKHWGKCTENKNRPKQQKNKIQHQFKHWGKCTENKNKKQQKNKVQYLFCFCFLYIYLNVWTGVVFCSFVVLFCFCFLYIYLNVWTGVVFCSFIVLDKCTENKNRTKQQKNKIQHQFKHWGK
jgi:hypothetical protein